jgi:hypothetical protein
MLFYRGWAAASTATFNARDPELYLVRRLRHFARKIDAVIDFSKSQCVITLLRSYLTSEATVTSAATFLVLLRLPATSNKVDL